jgi:hypothetical protein
MATLEPPACAKPRYGLELTTLQRLMPEQHVIADLYCGYVVRSPSVIVR